MQQKIFSVKEVRQLQKTYYILAVENAYEEKLREAIGHLVSFEPDLGEARDMFKIDISEGDNKYQDQSYVKYILKAQKVLSVNSIIRAANTTTSFPGVLIGKYIVAPLLLHKITKKEKGEAQHEDWLQFEWDKVGALFPSLDRTLYQVSEPMEEEIQEIQVNMQDPQAEANSLLIYSEDCEFEPLKPPLVFPTTFMDTSGPIIRRIGRYKPEGAEDDIYSELYFKLHTSCNQMKIIAVAAAIVMDRTKTLLRIAICDMVGNTTVYNMICNKFSAPEGLKIFQFGTVEEAQVVECLPRLTFAKENEIEVLIGLNLDQIFSIANKDITKCKRYEPIANSQLFSNKLPEFGPDTLELYAMAYMAQYRSESEENVTYVNKTLKEVIFPPPECVQTKDIFAFILETRAYPFVTKYISLDCEYFSNGHPLQGKFRKVALVNYYGTLWNCTCLNASNKEEQNAVKSEIKKRLLALPDIIVIGHSVHYAIEVLGLQQEIPVERRIDLFKKFYHVEKSKHAEDSSHCVPASLRSACYYYLGLKIQGTADHDPEEDAKAAMALYRWIEGSMDSKIFFTLPERGRDQDNKPSENPLIKREDGYKYYRE